jgi:hypothetical protein
MELNCIVCYYVPETPHEVQPAMTVCGGYAVCEDHMSLVTTGTDWYNKLRTAKEQHGTRSD